MATKSATLNLRVNPDAKQRAEAVLEKLGMPMSTAIDIYLEQISLKGGIPFAVTLPRKTEFDADRMDTTEIHEAIQAGIEDADAGRVQDASEVFAKFREKHI